MYYLAGIDINVSHVFISFTSDSTESRSTRVLRNVSTPPPTLEVPTSLIFPG